MSDKKKVFITGAEGFIGGHLWRALEKEGHECWGCDIVFSDNPRIKRVDVADFGGIERMIGFINPHIVFHLANYGNRYSNGFSYPMLWSTNVIGTEHLLELQKRYGFALHYTSSSEVYGTKSPEPVDENYEGDWWYNDYAASKWLCEKLIHRHIAENPHLSAMVFRDFGVYGLGQPRTKDNSVVAQFIDKISKNQSIEIHDCFRCFLYVSDCVDAYLSIMNGISSLASVKTYNLGTTENTSIRNLAGAISEILQTPFVESDKSKVLVGVKHKTPDISSIKADYGWQPKTSLREGLSQTIFGIQPQTNGFKPYGLFISVDGENKKPRRLSCAERCSNEELVIE